MPPPLQTDHRSFPFTLLCSPRYEEKLNTLLDTAEANISEMYDQEGKRIRKMRESEELFSIKGKVAYVSDAELTHSRFMAPPKFAVSRDLATACRELQAVGVLDSISAFSDLLARGEHELFATSHKQLLADENNDEFWWTLVTLWSIGVHKKIEEQFKKFMGDIARAGGNGVNLKVAPLKRFERTFEKAGEYCKEKRLQGVEKTLAPLHVIDMLRCSFTVDDCVTNLKIGRKLEQSCAVVRTKNGHAAGRRGYADRKYNLVFEAGGKGGEGMKVVTEIQVLMKRYVEIKKFGHLLYEMKR